MLNAPLKGGQTASKQFTPEQEADSFMAAYSAQGGG